MRRKGVVPLILFVVVTLGLLLYTFLAGNSPVLGLDLQGGVSVVLQPDGPVDNDETIDQAVDIIRNRVDALGVAEPDITRQGDTVLVQLPGVKDQCRALELVGQTAELRFRPVLQVLGPVGEEVPTTTTAPATTTTAPATTTTAAEEQSLGAGLVPGENAAGLQTPTTTTTVPATTTTAVPVEDDGTGVDSACRTEGEGEDEAPATTTTEPTEEQGLGAGLVPGENAAGLQTPPTTAAPTTTAPAAPTTVPGGAPTTTAPAGDAVQGTCAGVEDQARLDPATGLPRRLTDEGVTPRRLDVECNTVLLGERDDDGEIVTRYLLGPTALTGESLASAAAGLDTAGVTWQVNPVFKEGDEGIGRFNAIAAKCNVGDPSCPSVTGGPGSLAIVLDSEVISAPAIQEAQFERDQIQITGDFDEAEAKDLALVLNYGALPVTLEPQQTQTVSATLGEDSLRAGLISGIIGLLLTALFMIGYYRLLGVVAIASLTLEFALVWVLIAYLGETQGLALTLAGVTGLIVSIGISVDSNVVFYEHLKEDVHNGRTFRSTVDRSFDSSFTTIIKADIASLIGAVLLYWLSVGPVRGFALLLGISTIIDIIATWFFIRPAVLILARNDKLRDKPRWLGMPDVAPGLVSRTRTGTEGSAP